MTGDQVLQALKDGKKVTCKSWRMKNWYFYMSDTQDKIFNQSNSDEIHNILLKMFELEWEEVK